MAASPEIADPFQRLAKVLDTLPNGFPPTSSGVELQLLRKIFTPEEAELGCELRLTPQTPAEIAARTGRPLAGLAGRLRVMWERGQIGVEGRGEDPRYRLLPFIMGIFELQLERMDPELADLFERYAPVWGISQLRHLPQLFLVLPVESQLAPHHHALPFHRVSTILEAGRSFWVRRCVCRTQKQQLGQGCRSPMETCLGIGAAQDTFSELPQEGRSISMAEALAILRQAEEAGLVHNVHNVRRGHTFICNCCRCCCGLLVAARRFRLTRRAFNTHYYAEIDISTCDLCRHCIDERCPVEAISALPEGLRVDIQQCLGCGLCATTCPARAITLRVREESEGIPPPEDEQDWMNQRARARGRGFDEYR